MYLPKYFFCFWGNIMTSKFVIAETDSIFYVDLFIFKKFAKGNDHESIKESN